jgi:hypothetical protein
MSAMARWTPTQQASYALSYEVPRSELSEEAQAEYDRLKALALPERKVPTGPERFPTDPATRRQILEAIADKNGKYAKPFEKGEVAVFSLIGTESWSEYGAVVLQMAMLDTLLSIEEKLGKLLEQKPE